MDVLEYIKKMQEMYGDDVITTADKLEKPPKTVVREIFEDFNARNPKADGGQLVAPSVDGSRPGYQGKDYIPGYTKKARTANEIKYEKVLKEMLNEMDLIKEKGYGNVSSLVEKYSNKLGPTKEKTKRYYKADGTSGGINWNVQQRKIRGAVIDAAKQADVADLTDNMIKAVEDYKKFKGKITRGETAKIIRANKVPESSLYKALNKINAFVKQKKKYKNIDEKKKFIADERAASLKKYSSDNFEKITRGSQTIQGGHTGDIYNDFVTPKTKKYTPAFINQETLKEYDALIKSIGEARDKAIKAKNWKEVERLNTKGMNISAASEGYKTFKVVQPDGSSYIYGIDDITTTDPMNLTKVDTVQELTKGKDVEFEKAKKLYEAKKISKTELETARAAAEKRLLEAGTHRDLIKVQKKEAMKAAKLSKKNIKSLDKRLTENLEKLMSFCPAGTKVVKAAADGGRMGYADGPMCTPEEAARGMKQEIKKVQSGTASKGEASRTVNKLKNFGTKGMRGLLKAGLISEVLFEAALGFDKVISEGQSPMQAFRQSYLTAPLRAIGAVKSFEEGEREELLKSARDKGKVSRVLNLQNLIRDRNKLINKINNLKSNLNSIRSIGGDTFMAEKNLAAAQAKLQDMSRSGKLSTAEKLFSTKPQDLKLKDKSLIDAYNQAFEKRAVEQASRSSIAQSIAADRNRLRDRMNAEGILTTQDAKNELQDIGDYFGQGYTPYGVNKLLERLGFQNPGYGITKIGPATGKYNQEQGLQDFLNAMRTQTIADAGGVANLAGGGLASLTNTIPPKSGPMSQGLRSLYNNGRKL